MQKQRVHSHGNVKHVETTGSLLENVKCAETKGRNMDM